MEIEFEAYADGDLVAAFVTAHDQRAFEELVRRYGAMVMNTCRRGTATEEDAEDAFQATFLALAEKPRKIRRPSSVAAWLHQTAVRTVNAMQRKAIREKRHMPLVGQAMLDAAARKQQMQDLRELVDAEIGRLPERLQLAVVLCDLEGLTRRAAGERLGIPAATVAGYVTKARKLLSRRLSKRGLILSGSALALAMRELGETPVSAALVSETLEKSSQQTLGGNTPTSSARLARSTSIKGSIRVRDIAVAICILMLISFAWIARQFDLGAPSVPAQALVLPERLGSQEGDSNLFNGIPDQPTAFRIQQLHVSEEFPPGHHLLVGMRWRPDGDVIRERNVTIDRLEIVLSTTQATPGDGLRNDMAENHGPNATIVYATPFTFRSRDHHDLTKGPRPFDYAIRFDEPFAYDSCTGNLLVDLSLYLPGMPPDTLPPRVDAQSRRAVHSVVATGNTGDLADTRSVRVIVTQFDVIPPGPLQDSRSASVSGQVGGEDDAF